MTDTPPALTNTSIAAEAASPAGSPACTSFSSNASYTVAEEDASVTARAGSVDSLAFSPFPFASFSVPCADSPLPPSIFKHTYTSSLDDECTDAPVAHSLSPAPSLLSSAAHMSLSDASSREETTADNCRYEGEFSIIPDEGLAATPVSDLCSGGSLTGVAAKPSQQQRLSYQQAAQQDTPTKHRLMGEAEREQLGALYLRRCVELQQQQEEQEKRQVNEFRRMVAAQQEQISLFAMKQAAERLLGMQQAVQMMPNVQEMAYLIQLTQQPTQTASQKQQQQKQAVTTQQQISQQHLPSGPYAICDQRLASLMRSKYSSSVKPAFVRRTPPVPQQAQHSTQHAQHTSPAKPQLTHSTTQPAQKSTQLVSPQRTSRLSPSAPSFEPSAVSNSVSIRSPATGTAPTAVAAAELTAVSNSSKPPSESIMEVQAACNKGISSCGPTAVQQHLCVGVQDLRCVWGSVDLLLCVHSLSPKHDLQACFALFI